jgi:hypothetical protein
LSSNALAKRSLAFVSINAAANELWVTLRATLSHPTSIQILQSWR